MKTNNLSTIIITKNAERTIAACLKSVREISDEIIVLDSGSSDKTLTICQQYADLVKSTDWPGFGPQKERARQLAKGPWILSLDADEVLTKKCQQAILHAITQPYDAFYIRRLMIFAGKPVYHSGCSDAPLRLFKKSLSRFTNEIVHESVAVDGNISKINDPMLHYSYANIGEWILKMNLYSELGAIRKSNNKNYKVSNAVIAAMVSFIKMYLVKKGFLDGRLGFVAAINSAVASYYKYLKLALDSQFTTPKTNGD